MFLSTSEQDIKPADNLDCLKKKKVVIFVIEAVEGNSNSCW